MTNFFTGLAALANSCVTDALGSGHGAFVTSAGWHHLAPHIARSLTTPGAGAAALAAGMLWTATELPTAGTQRLPRMRLFMAVIGGIVALATLPAAAAVAISLLPNHSAGDFWPTVLALLILCGTGGLGAAVGFDALSRTGLFRRSILVLGTPPDWAGLGASFDPGPGPLFKVVDVLGLNDRSRLAPEALQRRNIWGIVLGQAPGAPESRLIESWRRAGLRVFEEAEFRERWLKRIDISGLEPGSLAGTRGRMAAALGRVARRLADIVLSLVLLILTLPVWILAAVLIKLDSPGPVFYLQERVGLHGRIFRVVKFRSMRADAEAVSGPQWANTFDPRITRVGGLLRLTRIDELPQIWNVLAGEMSLIGPRPERPYFVEQLTAKIPGYAERAVVKPGITGWAQVNYRYGASIEDARVKLAYDLYYVKHRSLLLDLRIIIATIRVVLFQEGAR